MGEQSEKSSTKGGTRLASSDGGHSVNSSHGVHSTQQAGPSDLGLHGHPKELLQKLGQALQAGPQGQEVVGAGQLRSKHRTLRSMPRAYMSFIDCHWDHIHI